MTEGVTKQYEVKRTRDVLYDVISSNITDPFTGQQARADASDWILQGFPNPAKVGQCWKFPFVVLPFSEVEMENRTLSGGSQAISHNVLIEVFSRTREEANEVADQIRHILVTSGQTELRKAAVFGPDITSTNQITDFTGGQKYYGVQTLYRFTRFD